MPKKRNEVSQRLSPVWPIGQLGQQPDQWQAQLAGVANRFNQEYQGNSFHLPEEVEAMPIFREWTSGILQAKLASPFWQIAQPQKNQSCLDIGCGISFLIYPWRDWQAFFFGQEVSNVAQEALSRRGPQLNSKLFKGVRLGPAHQLSYESNQFDLVIATGFSCYFSLDYWTEVMAEVKRVLKPGGQFVFDALNPDASLAENWAILETYLGAEVFLESLADWQKTIQSAGGQIADSLTGELFQLYSVQF